MMVSINPKCRAYDLYLDEHKGEKGYVIDECFGFHWVQIADLYLPAQPNELIFHNEEPQQYDKVAASAFSPEVERFVELAA